MEDRWYEDKWYKLYYFIPNALFYSFRRRRSPLEDIPSTLHVEAKLLHAGNCSDPVVFQTKEKSLLVLSPAQIVCMLPLEDKEKEWFNG